jgi:hypothetical protein
MKYPKNGLCIALASIAFTLCALGGIAFALAGGQRVTFTPTNPGGPTYYGRTNTAGDELTVNAIVCGNGGSGEMYTNTGNDRYIFNTTEGTYTHYHWQLPGPTWTLVDSGTYTTAALP